MRSLCRSCCGIFFQKDPANPPWGSCSYSSAALILLVSADLPNFQTPKAVPHWMSASRGLLMWIQEYSLLGPLIHRRLLFFSFLYLLLPKDWVYSCSSGLSHAKALEFILPHRLYNSSLLLLLNLLKISLAYPSCLFIQHASISTSAVLVDRIPRGHCWCAVCILLSAVFILEVAEFEIVVALPGDLDMFLLSWPFFFDIFLILNSAIFGYKKNWLYRLKFTNKDIEFSMI